MVNEPGTGGQSRWNKWSTCAAQVVNLARNTHSHQYNEITGTKSSLSCHGSGFFAVSFSLHNMGSLEKLFSKRDPDNRDAQDKALEEVAKSQQPPAYEDPDDVQESDRGPSPVFL